MPCCSRHLQCLWMILPQMLLHEILTCPRQLLMIMNCNLVRSLICYYFHLFYLWPPYTRNQSSWHDIHVSSHDIIFKYSETSFALTKNNFLLLCAHTALQLSVQESQASSNQSDQADVSKLLGDQSFVSSILASVSRRTPFFTVVIFFK